MSQKNLQRLGEIIAARPDHAGVKIELPVQKDAAYMWKAASIHPMQALQNVHQRIVRKAMRNAADDAAKMLDASTALSRFFFFDAAAPQLLPPPEKVDTTTTNFIEERLEELVKQQGQLGKVIRRAAERWTDKGGGAPFLSDDKKAQLVTHFNKGVKELNGILGAVPYEAALGKAIDDFNTKLGVFNGAEVVVADDASALPSSPAVRFNEVQSITADLKDTLADKCTELGKIAKLLLDVTEDIAERVDGMSCIANLYVIDAFYLWRLMIKYRCTAAVPITADKKTAISGDLTSLLHNGAGMAWLTTWLTQRLANLNKALAALKEDKNLIFYLKGGRALYYCIGDKDKGTNDFDTSIVINPNLPVDEWYELFSKVHNCCFEELRKYKHELLQLMEEKSKDFSAHLDSFPLGGSGADLIAVAKDDETVANEEFLALWQELSPDAASENAKAELIDIGIPRRDTTEVWEAWHLKKDIEITDGVPRPGPLYYVNEYVTMVREALVPGSRSGRKSGKRLTRLADLLKADVVNSAIDVKMKEVPPWLLKDAMPTLNAFKHFGHAGQLMLRQLAEAYLLQEDCGYLEAFIKDFNTQCASPTTVLLPDDIETGLTKVKSEERAVAKAIAQNVQCFHLFSTRMEQHIKDRGAFFSSERTRGEFSRFVKAIYTASIFNKPEDELEIMFAITGSFAATLHAEYANYERMGDIEPFHRVDLTVFCRQGVDPDVVMEVTVPAIVGAYEAHPETPAYVTTASEGNIVNIFWSEEVTFPLNGSGAPEEVALTYRPLAIRLTVECRPTMPQLSFIWGYPVLGLRDLAWDYIRHAGLTEEFGARNRLRTTAEALTDLLTRHENPGMSDKGKGPPTVAKAAASGDDAAAVVADPVAPVGHEIAFADGFLVAQECAEWCYAAVTVMMRRVSNQPAAPVTQTNIVMEIYPAATLDNAVAQFGSVQGYVSLQGTISSSKPLPWADIKDLLDADKPIVFGTDRHYMLIIGYRGPNELMLWDPLPVGEGAKRWITYTDYKAAFAGGHGQTMYYA